MTKAASELNLPDDLKYTKDHEWSKVEDDTVTVGLDDYAQDQLGDIVFVEMPEVGDSLSKGDVFATVESVKAVSECYMPISGEVTAVNEGLEDEPELVNTDCYVGGWFIKIKASDLSEIDTLMDATACRASVGE
ncbi:MAG: glycine cleavage system protein GcvH [Deltaproteobacteria bacterium]|nr:glycine cleavage system protein GcvH [Deltaproteobacteria bacterium]